MSFLYARSAEEEAVRLAKVAQQRAMLDEQVGGSNRASATSPKKNLVKDRQEAHQAAGGSGYMDGFMSGFGRPGAGAPNVAGVRGSRHSSDHRSRKPYVEHGSNSVRDFKGAGMSWQACTLAPIAAGRGCWQRPQQLVSYSRSCFAHTGSTGTWTLERNIW